MTELLHESLRTINFPFSVLLLVATLYWLLAMFAGLDIHLLDFHADADVDVDLDLDVNHDVGHGNPLGPIGHWLHLGEAPVTIILSILIGFMWAFSVVSNYYLNKGDSLLIGGGLLLVNFLFCTFLTGLMVIPIAAAFRKIEGPPAKQDVVGDVCKVISGQVDSESGQAEIENEAGAPIVVNARTASKGEVVTKGNKAVVVRKNDNGTYIIKSLEA